MGPGAHQFLSKTRQTCEQTFNVQFYNNHLPLQGQKNNAKIQKILLNNKSALPLQITLSKTNICLFDNIVTVTNGLPKLIRHNFVSSYSLFVLALGPTFFWHTVARFLCVFIFIYKTPICNLSVFIYGNQEHLTENLNLECFFLAHGNCIVASPVQGTRQLTDKTIHRHVF